MQRVWKNRGRERERGIERERARARKRLANGNWYPPIEYLEHERTTWFFVGISGSDLSNGKDGIGRRSNGKKRVLAEKLKELEKRKKRRKKGREGKGRGGKGEETKEEDGLRVAKR